MEQIKKPLMTVAPSFVPRIIMWRALPWVLGGTFVLTVAGGTILWFLISIMGFGRAVSAGVPYFLCFVAGLTGIAPFYYELQRKIYARTFCHFFEQHLEYETYTLLFRHHAGRVRYRDISGMYQRSNFLQQRDNLKTIYLVVPEMDWQDRGFYGVKLIDVPVGKGIGRRIQTLLDHEQAVAPAPVWVAPAEKTATLV